MKKKILALTISAVLAVSLIACGDEAAGNDAAVSGAENNVSVDEQKVDAYAAALENMNGVTNMSSKMVMEMDMSVEANGEAQSMQTVTTMGITCFSDPLHMKIDMSMDMGELGSFTQTAYAEKDESGSLNLYTYDGTNWASQTLGESEIEQYDARTNMLSYMDNSYNYVEAGTEQVDGANAYKYTGAITGDAINETMLSTGALDSLSQIGLDESDLESMMNDLGEIPVTLWIDEASLYPVQFESDMTDVMNKLMFNMIESVGEEAAGASISFSKMKIVMTCSDFNSAADFEIPAEAKVQ